MDLYQLIDTSEEPILKTHDWIQEAKEKQKSLEGVQVKSIREAKCNYSRKSIHLNRSRSIFYLPPVNRKPDI